MKGKHASKIDDGPLPPTAWLGVLGVSGYTGYVGTLKTAQAQPEDTVVVSAASGAVGSAAAQVARVKGCRVIGIAGGLDNCNFAHHRYRSDCTSVTRNGLIPFWVHRRVQQLICNG